MTVKYVLQIATVTLCAGALVLGASGANAATGVARRPTATPRPPRPTATPVVAPTGTPQPGPVCWSVVNAPVLPGNETVLTSVHGSGPNDVWAVGYTTFAGARQTLTMRWNGAAWAVVPSPNPLPASDSTINALYGVTAISPTDAWAVGYSASNSQSYATLTMHWNGSQWQIVPSPNLPQSRPDVYNALNSVSATSATDVWAVGGAPSDFRVASRAVLMHWDGAAWSITPEPAETGLWSTSGRTGVTAVAGNDVWTVGEFNAFHWNGSAWSVPAGFSGQKLLGIDHSGPDNVWSVGSIPLTIISEGGAYPGSATTNRFNGSAWSTINPVRPNTNDSYGFSGVSAVSPTNAWAVGFNGRFTLTQQWDGSAWRIVASANGNANPSPDAPISNQLFGVHANSATDIWAVGAYWDSAFTNRSALIERYVCQ